MARARLGHRTTAFVAAAFASYAGVSDLCVCQDLENRSFQVELLLERDLSWPEVHGAASKLRRAVTSSRRTCPTQLSFGIVL